MIESKYTPVLFYENKGLTSEYELVLKLTLHTKIERGTSHIRVTN